MKTLGGAFSSASTSHGALGRLTRLCPNFHPLSAITISTDSTYGVAYKGTVVEKDKKRTRTYKGGLVPVINERNSIITWVGFVPIKAGLTTCSPPLQRLCHTQGNAELEELLQGLKRRFALLGIEDPEIAVADNCCHVKITIRKVFPGISVCLDVWHFMMRYLICMINGTKNPHRAEVARDIVDAIVKSPAKDKTPAVYWSQEEQEVRLQRAYKKWADHGGVWTAAAEKAHVEQLAHVKKGCLARPRCDVRSDGSRIEGTNRGFNGLQRSHASGLETHIVLCHDFVNRRNVRVEFATSDPSAFIASTDGSHHLRLVNACAQLWNSLIADTQAKGQPLPAHGVHPLPTMAVVNSGETFGLMKMSVATAAHYALANVKAEPEDDNLLDLSSQDLLDASRVLQEIGIDPALLHLIPSNATPQPPPTVPTAAAAFSTTMSSAGAASAASTSALNIAPAAPSSNIAPATPSSNIAPAVPSSNIAPAAPSSNIAPAAPSSNIAPAVPALNIAPATPSSNIAPASSSGTTNPASQSLHHFFAPRGTPQMPAPSNVAPKLPFPNITGITRSQRVFSIATGIDPRTLSFGSASDRLEFFAFMDLRDRNKWASYKMTNFDWVCAASMYNVEISKINAKHGKQLPMKTPRALMEKLGEIESAILTRIRTSNYKSHSGGTRFWMHHCHAVPLTEKATTRSEQDGKAKNRKSAVCSRCNKLMYPGKEGSDLNHKRIHCSDGVRQKFPEVEKIINGLTVKIVDQAPAYPQPHGLFTGGTHFHPMQLIQEVRSLYERVVVRKETLGIHDLALAAMLHQRTLVLPSSGENPRTLALFKLYPCLKLEPEPTHLLVEYEGARYLSLDELVDPIDVQAQMQRPAGSDGPDLLASTGGGQA
ncbi:hypothetical protein C8Q76DRAFT_631245 [Earliella scabrosa]|nr:hypothetical protein C8Q76DRAFT_631245 [Earliella scabrosa]